MVILSYNFGGVDFFHINNLTYNKLPSIDLREAASFVLFCVCWMELFSRSHRELTLELDSDFYTRGRER